MAARPKKTDFLGWCPTRAVRLASGACLRGCLRGRRRSSKGPGPFWRLWSPRICHPKTIQRHVDNLWASGGEIIRDLNENPSLRRKSIGLFSMTESKMRGTPRLCPGAGRTATAALQFHLPEAPPVPQPIAALNPCKITHRFRRRGTQKDGLPHVSAPRRRATHFTNFAISSITSGATWPGLRYSASVLLPSPATKRWFNEG
jgi:hypothetical protein